MKETERVEREARQIVKTAQGDSGLHTHVAREIALSLEALDRTRALHQWQEEQLLLDECRIGTDLARIEHLHPLYSREEATLRARLLVLSVERRRLNNATIEQLTAQYRTLLELVHRYQLLSPNED